MSYRRSRGRYRVGMAGISSRAPGMPVARKAIGDDAHEYGLSARGARPPMRAGRAMAGPPHWYSAMQGASLGDDGTSMATTLATPTLVDPDTAAWQASMAAGQQQMISAMNSMVTSTQGYMSKETLQRWLQLAATLSIPLAAAVWRVIFKGASSSTS